MKLPKKILILLIIVIEILIMLFPFCLAYFVAILWDGAIAGWRYRTEAIDKMRDELKAEYGK